MDLADARPDAESCSLPFPTDLSPPRCQVRMPQRVFASHPSHRPLGAAIFPLAGGRAGSYAVFSSGGCRHLEKAMLMQTSPAPAPCGEAGAGHAEVGTHGQPGSGSCRCFTPGQGCQPCRLNELSDFRLNEQAARTMTKPPCCKEQPKFKMLWPNVAPLGISANTPCISFL